MAGYYLFRPGKIPEGLTGRDRLCAAFRKLCARRRVTAALMIVIAVLFLVGINFLDELDAITTIVLWLVILVMLLVVLVLAFFDLRGLAMIRFDMEQGLGKDSGSATPRWVQGHDEDHGVF